MLTEELQSQLDVTPIDKHNLHVRTLTLYIYALTMGSCQTLLDHFKGLNFLIIYLPNLLSAKEELQLAKLCRERLIEFRIVDFGSLNMAE